MQVDNKKGHRILVLGDIMLDTYTHGNSSRLSPEAPVPVVDLVDTEFVLGGCGNVSAGIRALGHDVEIIAFYGNDSYGEKISYLLSERGIINSSVILADHKTIVKNRVVVGGHQIVRIDSGNFYVPDITIIKDRIIEFSQSYSAIVISDYNKGAMVHAAEIIKLSRELGVFTIVDPKVPDWSRYANCDIITPNKVELNSACSFENIAQDTETSARILMEKFSIGSVLVTLGAEGMLLLDRKISTMEVPAKIKKVFDVTGAGDTVVAALASFLSRGGALSDAVRYANEAAAIAVSNYGTKVVSCRDINMASCI